MHAHNSRSGITLVEGLVAAVFLSLVALAAIRFLTGAVSSQGRDFNRWRAQIALENVTDLVASLNEGSLQQMINDECLLGGGTCPGPIGNATRFYTATAHTKFAWIANWGNANLLTNLKFQFKVYLSSGVQVLAPVTTPLTKYDIDVITTVTYSKSPAPGSETISWTKRLASQ